MRIILPFIFGMLFGLTFKNDIPIIRDINYTNIRYHVLGIFKSFQGDST